MENICKTYFLKIFSLKKYFFLNIMAICGYAYAAKLHQLNQVKTIIYSSPGADTTDAGIMHSFDCATVLATFIILSFFLAILGVAEFFLRKKFWPNGFIKHKPNLFVEIAHSVLFWIGFWFPLSRLVAAILFLVIAPISEFLSNFS